MTTEDGTLRTETCEAAPQADSTQARDSSSASRPPDFYATGYPIARRLGDATYINARGALGG